MPYLGCLRLINRTATGKKKVLQITLKWRQEIEQSVGDVVLAHL